ncbi:MAG: 4-hydroxy-tetrahydrodipicolinate reductase [Flavobacteriales bacterium]|nr:4-hydroxy-tetrahydrodipicolinate reductase [Flavobacteriales bacterium]
MNIALLGYGKMGRAIEAVAQTRGHQVALKVGSTNAGTAPSGADVAIEFSRPEHALANMRLCLEAGVPVVVGTTGWYDHLEQVKALVQEHRGALLWASNFSIGVNLFFRLNRQLALLMDQQPRYTVHIDEIHHIHKLDAPSGTAITTARDIDLRVQRYSGWELRSNAGHAEPVKAQASTGANPQPSTPVIPIHSERTGEVPGKHSVTWRSPEDRITLTHEAFGRQGFATGAVIAAEWLKGRTGLFTMDDVLDNH